MDNIKVLEEIGLKRVSDETHIEQKYIKYIIDGDFEKLNRTNALGFIKILSQTYKLDLSDWSEAFEEYWVDNHKDDEEKGLFIVVDDKSSSKKLLVFILLVILIATLGMLFSLFQDKINLDDYINKDKTSFEQSSIVEDTQKTLDEINNSMVSEEVASENKVQEDTNKTQIETSSDVVQNDVKHVEIISNDIDKNVTEQKKEVVLAENNLTQEMGQTVTEKVSPKFEDEAIITPNTKLWVGLIYLDNKKRRSFLGDGNFSIDTSRDQIITTGHGSFNLTKDGKRTEFHKQAPMRFLVKDKNITQISLSRFKELNEGQPW